MLFEIKNIAKAHKILIKSFAFDGDGCYNSLHRNYYQSYINTILKKPIIPIIKKFQVQRVSTDGLHLFKRFRYRILSCRVHPGFHKKSSFIEIESLIRTLNFLPTIVFNNERITKMNDHLPLLLFQKMSLMTLIGNRNYIAASFWLPITSSIIALTDKSLSFEWQQYFFEIALWFFVFYKKSEEINEVADKDALKQRKRGDDLDVKFYTEE
ncbi:hypothetical protein M9Y10_004629 [Tritrichomonas musculus]|uniref:Uncharacterized protein n=1 Tax=Tritrichomonas musculus TaxID=1915356 RepID=A0ABR2JJK0_9EUKA